MSQLSIWGAKSYDPLNPNMSHWDKEALVYTPPTESTLRAAYRARELAEEGSRLARAETKPWYTNIGGYEISRRPTGSQAILAESEKVKAKEESGEEYWWLPETTRNAALRARELEIEAKRKDLERRKMNRFTWVGGLPSWAKKDATVPQYVEKTRGMGVEATM